ncbi:MAG: hypothetical protein Solivirus2_47 [Solivirus sp.]|uniref:Ankyrin repeat protein n=1 Tax=Solivirus sp. TaxID=2487772 RepID=A0A3G5AFI6_9VIRU|nr:MAG: hypothetical protein Solivirus2_47 [Solivirus sp.]
MKRDLDNIIIQNLSILSKKNFDKTCKLAEFEFYCRGDLSERVYEERVKKHFDNELIKYKEEDMTWKEFYERLYTLIDYLPAYSDYTDPLIRDAKLMELEILFAIKKKFNVRDYNTIAILLGKRTSTGIRGSEFQKARQILLLLEKARVFPIYFINQAQNGHETVFTYGQNLSSVAAINGNLDGVKWLKRYGFLPSKKAYEIAEYRGHRNIIEWAKSLNLF